ncbi:MAG: GYD domain-containing protein [Xanthobacteraceae bacterium]
MPIYISRGRFTSDAVKGMLAKPDREEAVAKLFKSVGGRLIGWYLTFGRHIAGVVTGSRY